jgi:hypothetical protein
VAPAHRLGQGAFLFTVDAEGGFSDDPQEVARFARRLHDAGAAGINLEDGRPDGTLASAELHAAKIAAVKASAPALFVNARTDTHWLGCQEEKTAERLAVYEQAGADGMFVPGLSDPDKIAALTATVVVPLNILYTRAQRRRTRGPGGSRINEERAERERDHAWFHIACAAGARSGAAGSQPCPPRLRAVRAASAQCGAPVRSAMASAWRWCAAACSGRPRQRASSPR